MTAAEAGLKQETEAERITRWRAGELERVGYDHDSATSIAERLDIDLHLATDLIEQGCAPELALRILI